MLKFYPSRLRLITDAVLSFCALGVVVYLATLGLGRVDPWIVAIGAGPFVLGFGTLLFISLAWALRRLPTLEASEEVFTIRRLWGTRVVVRWTEVAEIQQALVFGGRHDQKMGLVLRFVTNSGRFSQPLDVSQARLAKPLKEVVTALIDQTMARYVLSVQREAPPEWRQKRGPSVLLALLLGLVLVGATAAALFYFGVLDGLLS